jgi:predicted ATPase
MSNSISFVSVHKSLTSFEAIDLPNFVVLTGRNGSGKTHLLTGITSGKIKSSLVSDVSRDVKLFDSTSIIPQDTGAFDPSQEHSRRSQWFNVVEFQREQALPNIQLQLIALGVPAEHCSTAAKIKGLTVEKLTRVLADPTRAVEVEPQIRQALINSSNQIFSNSQNQIGDDGWRKASAKVQQRNPELFFDASRSTFFEDKDFLWGEVDPFQQAFGRVFTTYRDLIHANDRLAKYPPPDEPTRRYLGEAEFVKEHGSAPWDFVNQILSACFLDFRVDHPPLHEISSYEPKLRKLSGDVVMRFQDLSSGEKVLMSFALCLYNSEDSRQTSVFPKLLLLDEVDAPLHPSMAASLIKTIQDVLVRDKNVAVILTTHSPSTVALAPEESIFSMNPQGPKIEKISRSAALSLLTAGVPTLSVSFDGRRQVFVESRTDAYLYDMLYQRFKSKIKSERSLVFVQVGHSAASGGEHNSGCAQVKRLVETLSQGGNQTVYGLVDWDCERIPTERVHVLAPKIRNGLESLLLDPVLLVALIARENKGLALENKLLITAENYISLKDWDQTRWQMAVEAVQKIVFPNADFNQTINVSYVNGMTLRLTQAYLHADDHTLENHIVELFPFLKPKAKRTGELMTHMVETVLSEMSDLLPTDMLRTFQTLLDSPDLN